MEFWYPANMRFSPQGTCKSLYEFAKFVHEEIRNLIC